MGESVMTDTGIGYGSFLRALNVKPYRPFIPRGPCGKH